MLQSFFLFRNNFVGWIPSGLAACQYLQIISLSHNTFVDAVPTWLAQLPQINALYLGANQIIGTIPDVLFPISPVLLCLTFLSPTPQGGFQEYMQELSFLNLGVNFLAGPVPSSLGNLSKLSYLQLSTNSLSGSVQEALGSI